MAQEGKRGQDSIGVSKLRFWFNLLIGLAFWAAMWTLFLRYIGVLR